MSFSKRRVRSSTFRLCVAFSANRAGEAGEVVKASKKVPAALGAEEAAVVARLCGQRARAFGYEVDGAPEERLETAVGVLREEQFALIRNMGARHLAKGIAGMFQDRILNIFSK